MNLPLLNHSVERGQPAVPSAGRALPEAVWPRVGGSGTEALAGRQRGAPVTCMKRRARVERSGSRSRSRSASTRTRKISIATTGP